MLREFLSQEFPRRTMRQTLAVVRFFDALVDTLVDEEYLPSAPALVEVWLRAMQQTNAHLTVDNNALTPDDVGAMVPVIEAFRRAMKASTYYEWPYWSRGLYPLTQMLAFLVDGEPLDEGILEAELPEHPQIRIGSRLCRDAEHTVLVDESDPRAAFVAYGPNTTVGIDTLRSYELPPWLMAQVQTAEAEHASACRIVRETLEMSRGRYG